MGEFYALLTAAFWACAVLLFKRSGETLPPFALNFFRVVVSSILLLVTMLILDQAPWRAVPRNDLLTLALSGVIAIALADTFFHASLNRVGAGITAIVDCLYAPLIAFFAFFMLDEALTLGDLLGMILVLSGILVTAKGSPPTGTTRRTLLVGVVLGALGMITLTFGIVLAVPVLENHPVVWATGIRQFAALAVMLPIAMVTHRTHGTLNIFRLNRSVMKFALPGTLLGSYLALMFWIAGMKYTEAGSAAILNQSSTIYIILLARVFLGESLTKRKILACFLAFSGVLCVILI